MALKGDLASVELAQVFQMLALNQKVGLLNIEGPVEDRALYFDQRGVTLWYSEPALLEEVLSQQVGAGRIESKVFRLVEAEAKGSMEAAVRILTTTGAMTPDQLATACRQEIEEEIYDLFFWKDAHFEFHEGAKALPHRDGRINSGYFFSPDSLIMEAARRMDEWAFVGEKVSGPDEVFLRLPDAPGTHGLDQETLSILQHVDGKRIVSRIVEVAGRPAFHVHKALAHLVEKGFVGPIHHQDLPAQAKECLAEGRTEEAIQLLEKAIQEGVSPAACHSAAATAYERLGERAASCYHQRCFAEKLMESGRNKEAAEILAHVRDVIPTDLSVRERLVELVSGPKAVHLAGFDPVAEGKLLVDLLVEMGETDRARDTIERLLVGRASDLELKKTLIGVYSGAGDTKRVLELYESIANDLVLKNDLIEAVKYLQKVLLFDRGRKDISDRIRQLYVLDERKRIRRRGLTYAILGLILMGVLGGAYYFYETHVRSVFETLPAKAEVFIESKDHAAALAVYEQFMATYSFSLTARQARGEIARIAALKSQHDEELDRQALKVDADRQKIRSEYRATWGRYQDVGKREHDPEDSLKLLERVEWLVKSTGAEEDRTWARQVKLEEIRTSLTEHLAGAWTLARKARQALEEGKPKDAYAMVMSLHDRYGLTAIAKATPIPFIVESRPNGAEVFVDGQPVMLAGSDPAVPAVTPVILELLLSGKKTVQLHLKGHKSSETVLAHDSPFPVVITLPVIPALSIDVGKRLAGPYSVDHRIGVLSSRSEVFVVDVPSGRERFAIRLTGLAEVAMRPVISPDRIALLTTDARITSILTKDGSTAWSRQLRPNSKPLVTESDGYLYVCEDDGGVLCLETRTGKELWTARTASVAKTSPAVLGRSVFLVTTDQRLLVLRSDDGAFRSDHKIDGAPICPPLPVGNSVLLLLEGGRLVCIDLETKATLWSEQLQAGIRSATMCLVDSSVLIATDDGRIAKRALADGREEVARDLGSKPGGGGLVINGGAAYVITRSPDRKTSFVQAMYLTDLSFRWEHQLDGEPTGQLVSSSGNVFVVTDRGKVLGFE